jgi:hypothetical protein
MFLVASLHCVALLVVGCSKSNSDTAGGSAAVETPDSAEASPPAGSSAPPLGETDFSFQADSIEQALVMGDAAWSTSGDSIMNSYLESLPAFTQVVAYEDYPEARFWENFLGGGHVYDLQAKQLAVSVFRSQAASVSEKELAWERLRRQSATMEEPQIAAIYARPLIVRGEAIQVQRDASANRNIGLAHCTKDNKPTIIVAANPDKSLRMNAYSLLFFREHELAHHQLGHVRCIDGKPRRTESVAAKLQQQELEADCMAASVLEGFLPDGIAVVDRAHSIIGILPSFDDKHPPPVQRTRHIDSCIRRRN